MKTGPRTFPPMRCDSGCGECCGVVACSRIEADAVTKYAQEHGIKPVAQGTTCPWYQGGSCSVYEARPFVCRAYGHVEAMRCPRGYNTNISADKERSLLLAAKAEDARTGTAFLHEAVYTEEELVALVERLLNDTTPITVGGEEYRKPDAKAYSAGRTIKMVGAGCESRIFIDETTGELT